MGLYDEPHDIRYLHDSGLGKKSQKDGDGFLRSLLRKKQLVAGAAVLTILVGTSLVVLNMQSSKDQRAKAIEELEGEKTEGKIQGTVVCDKQSDSSCTLAVVTDDGEKYIVNESLKDASSLNEGDKVVVEGTLIKSPENSTIVVKDFSTSGLPQYKTPTPVTNQSATNPQISVSQDDLPEATPTPAGLKNNTPTSGTDYLTISYVIQNKEQLAGQNVSVKGYLVGGYIGIPGCDFEPNCNHSKFILSDFNSANRDTNFDVLYVGGTDDKEGDYQPGQDFYSGVKVVLDGETLYLEKTN